MQPLSFNEKNRDLFPPLYKWQKLTKLLMSSDVTLFKYFQYFDFYNWSRI